MRTMAEFKRWIKRSETPLAWITWNALRTAHAVRVPLIRPLHRSLYALHHGVAGAAAYLTRMLWWTPLFLSIVETQALGLQLEGGMPAVLGPVRIRLGRGCRISGSITLSGRTAAGPAPLLELGDDVCLGWKTGIYVGTKVSIGDNVLIAGGCFLAGYPGHPLDAAARAAGAPDTPDQIGDIVLEPDVWLATGVTILPGVRIGRGTVVGTGSIVTRDLPLFVLAAGSPARVLRRFDAQTDSGGPKMASARWPAT